VKATKPAFLYVGEPTESYKKTAVAKKANLEFFSAATLEGQEEGSVLYIDDGKVAATLAKGGDLDKFISDNSYPLVGQLSPENYQFYMDRGLDMFWFGLNTDDEASVAAIKEGVADFAGKYSYVWLDYGKFEGFLKQQMGCSDVKCGILVKNNIKYRLSDNGEALSAAGIKAFLEKDAAGTLKSFVKSQDEPKEAEEDNVVVLTANNFENNVKGKNVLVFFYAPWCGHCKSAKPEYEKLKNTLNRDDVVVAKFDATENDIPHSKCDVQGFPTFYFFKAGDYENPVAYNGGRDIDSWVKFINAQVPEEGQKQDL